MHKAYSNKLLCWIQSNFKYVSIKKEKKNFTVIGESGIKSNENIKKYNDHGVYNFLIGETILRSSNYDSMIKKLLKKW